MTGSRVVYFGFDGQCYSARYHVNSHTLEIRTGSGKLVASAIMSEDAAQLFASQLREPK